MQNEIVVRTFAFNDAEIEKQIKYTNGDITVIWKPDVCHHSGRCVTQLPGVFNLKAHPWVNMQGTGNEDIIKQVQRCPTGALTVFKNEPVKTEVN